MSTVSSRSVKTYSCHQFGASAAAATSSRRSNAVLETTMTVPAREARASGGDLAVGMRTLLVCPRRDQDRARDRVAENRGAGSAGPGPVSIRGRITQSSNARRFSARVHSSPAPPA
jgi:hypothetical protein